MDMISEHVLEVRYKPNAKILDYRGTWAEGISKEMELDQWGIVENRVDVYNKDKTILAFVGYKNAGFVVHDAQTKNYFSDKAVKFFKYLFSLEGFGKELHVNRIGVRSRFAKKYDGPFEELVQKYEQNYLTLNPEAAKVIDAELVDIGGPLNFKDKAGNFNTMSGPMESKQLVRFFDRDSDTLPEVSLFFDIDYWIKPDEIMAERHVLNKVKTFAEASWERFEDICHIVIGE